MSNLKASAPKPAAPAQAAQPKWSRTMHATPPDARGKVAPARDVVDIASTQLYRSDPQQRIEVIRRGIPAASVGELSARMGVSKEHLINSLRLSRATINRKEREGTLLSSDESERVLGVETLIGMVQSMVEQSGDPEGFDAPRWVATWLAQPLPALAGATPASYMDTFEGQKLVAEILSMSQSGAYA
jgi:uncharacterized protein (DUF2384 family)